MTTDTEVLSCYNILHQYLAFYDFYSRDHRSRRVAAMTDRDRTLFKQYHRHGRYEVHVMPPNWQREGDYHIIRLGDDTYKVRHPTTKQWFIFMIGDDN